MKFHVINIKIESASYSRSLLRLYFLTCQLGSNGASQTLFPALLAARTMDSSSPDARRHLKLEGLQWIWGLTAI